MQKPMTEQLCVNVDLDQRSYPILIAAGLLERADIANYIHGERALIVTNITVEPLLAEHLLARLGSKKVEVLVLPDGEQYKTLDSLQRIYDHLIENGHDRKTTLIALGGGVIGDMTGFAAATYQRGVNFIQVPTTLLAQVDSSVGGKTAVNHPMGKNMIGAFYQPQSVFIDTDVLQTLPPREFAAGLAEVIKYGAIVDPEFFVWLEDNSRKLLGRDSRALAYAIEQSCRAKALVVSSDETEQGRRAILNFGHTFGHAIETWQNYKGLLHGEAVAVGMLMAARLSALRGWLTGADVARLQSLLGAVGLPTAVPEGMAVEDFATLMLRDKKVLDGQLRLVLLSSIGEAIVVSDTKQSTLLEAVKTSLV